MAGHAAHSMPSHRGQGLNNALQDAWDIVQVVGKVMVRAVRQDEKIQGGPE